MNIKTFKFFMTINILAFTSCSSSPKQPPPPDQKKANQTSTENIKLKQEVEILHQKIDSLDQKISSLYDKVNLTNKNKKPIKQKNITRVSATPTSTRGVPIVNDPIKNKKIKKKHVNHNAIEMFKSALILFQSKQYSESILAFSSFIDTFSTNILSGAAQFYIGENYFNLNEYNISLQEYKRVLTRYPKSSHVTESLKRLAETNHLLKRTKESNYYRSKLLSFFPLSPAAGKINLDSLEIPKQSLKSFGDIPPVSQPQTAPMPGGIDS